MRYVPSISVVILNWNGRSVIEGCLRSVLESDCPNVDVIVVDNGSTDGSAAMVKRRFAERVRLIELGRNAGYGAGNNAGILQSRGEFVALLNNDVEVDPRCLSEMVRVVWNDDGIGMVACKVLSYRDRSEIDNVGHLLYPDGLNRGRGRLEKDAGQYDQESEALFPSGCAALYRRAMLDQIGGFDEDFFAYADDTDIGLRGRLAGWRCSLAPKAIAYHRYSASSGPYSPLKAFYVERNRIFIAIKYLPLGMLLLSPAFTLARYACQAWGAVSGTGAAGRYVHERSAGSLLLILLKAYVDALKYVPRMIRRRFEYRSRRSLASSEFHALLRKYRIGVRQIALKD